MKTATMVVINVRCTIVADEGEDDDRRSGQRKGEQNLA